MKTDPKLWLFASAGLAILMLAGAKSWKTLESPRAVASPAVTPLAPLAPKAARHRVQDAAAPEPELPTAPRPRAETPAEREPPAAERIKTEDRLIAVTARCDAAEEAYRKIQADSSQLGQTPHPSITQAWSRMRLALDSARGKLDRGEVVEARDSLDIAEVSAGKVIRAAGGN